VNNSNYFKNGDTGDLWLIKVRGTSRVSSVDLCYQPNHPLLTIGDGKKRIEVKF
jgi:hypothetical protein